MIFLGHSFQWIFILQESLASMGQVVNATESNSSSPQTEASEAPHNSLLSELDTQYRILIEKYEALVEARERSEEQAIKKDRVGSPPASHSLVDSGVDEVSGPMSLVMTEVPHVGQSSMNATIQCQRCTTCSCDLNPSPRPKSTLEDLSEVETSSSGFSEGESRLCTKMTQTEIIRCCCNNDDAAITPTQHNERLLDLTSSINPCDRRFACQPDYRELFHEIFEMLKQERKDIKVGKAVRKTLLQYQEFETRMNNSCKNESSSSDVTNNSNTKAAVTMNSCSGDHLCDENEENKSPNVITKSKKKEKKGENKELKKEATGQKEVLNKEEESKEISKPSRPDFLDLETSSRCSSRSRRRKKSNRNRQDSGELQTSQKKQLNHHGLHSHQFTEQPPPQKTETQNIAPEVASNALSSTENCRSLSPSATTTTASSNMKETVNKNRANPHEKRSLSKSSKERCEHKARKNKHHRHKQHQLQNKHLNNVLLQHPPFQPPRQHKAWSSNHAGTSGSIDLPSVQVARLIKFEKSYAEVLKSKPPKDHKRS